MTDKKIYFNSGFTNQVKKTSDKQPDYRINMVLSAELLNELLENGGKIQLSGWKSNFGNGETVKWSASADNYVKPAQEANKANGYQKQSLNEYPDQDLDSIPF